MTTEIDIPHSERGFDFAAIYNVLLLLAMRADGSFLFGFLNLYHR